jgi:guanylate kinase
MDDSASNKGSLYVIAAPSGAGKTTLVRVLTESLPNVIVSISHTTRKMRPNEKNGEDYYFVSPDEFKRLIEHGDFLEYATVFNQLYGTSKSMVEQTLAKGIDVILEIDWQGHQTIRHLMPECIGIFILPPSLDVLRDRLTKRDQDEPDVIEQRLSDVRETVSHLPEFDYVVINDDFTRALHDLKVIIESGRLGKQRQIDQQRQLINSLLHVGDVSSKV